MAYIDIEPLDRKPVMCDIDACKGAVTDIFNIGGTNIGLCKVCGDELLDRCRQGRKNKSLWEELLK